MIADGWFPVWAPTGLYLGCGTARVTLARVANVVGAVVTLADITDVGQGGAGHWFNPGGAPTDTFLYYDRAASLLTVNTPPPFVSAFHAAGAFNSYGAGGGVYAGYVAPETIEFNDGPSITPYGMAVPSGPVVDQDGRATFASRAGTDIYVRLPAGAPSTVDSFAGGVVNPHISTQGLVWQRFTGGIQRTFGWRGSNVEDVHAASGSEYAVPVDTPVGPYILSHSGGVLFLRPWGSVVYTTIAVGVTNFPHAVHTMAWGTAGGFLIAWSDASGLLVTTFLDLDVTAAPAPTPTPPPGPGPGLPPPALTVTPVERFVPRRKAIYPHVSRIADPPAQDSIKLLWDRMHELTERLEVGAIATRFDGVEASVAATNTRLDQQRQELEQNPAATLFTQIPGGSPPPTPTPPPPGPGPGPGPGGSGCSDSPGTGHFDPGGALTETRARKISCGTGDEFNVLRAATATLAERENNAEILVRRIIWHLAQGGYTAGRQRNPSTAISKDKIALVIGAETRAFDIFIAYDDNTQPLTQTWNEVFPADLVADAGIAD